MKCARADKLDGAVGGDHDQRRREPGNRPGLQTQGSRGARTPPFELNPPDPSRAPQPRPAPGRDHRNAVGRVVGLFHAGPQLRRPADLFLAGHLGGWLALFRPAREPQAHAVDLGEAEHRAHRPDHFSLPAQRRLFGPEAQTGVAVESCAGRFQVVALRAPGLSPFAFPPRHRFLVGAKLADAARHRAGIHRHHGAGRQRPQARRRRRIGASELALCVDRTAAR